MVNTYASTEIKKDGVHAGLLKIDITCVDAEVRYPTDFDLFSEPYLEFTFIYD